MLAIQDGVSVAGTHRFTGRSNYRNGEAGVCTALAVANGETGVEELPRAVYLQEEIHSWISNNAKQLTRLSEEKRTQQ
jgi:hypothetical protein